MKKVSIILSALLISFVLTGCNSKTENDYTDNAMQELYNRSIVAKEFADKEFHNLLDHFDSACEILETSYGFYTSETPVYIVGYKYTNGTDDSLTYAYKISVDDNQSCHILEEGKDTAAFLFESSKKTTSDLSD
ncbi:MAG: hypothetical protein Q4D50_04875 [Eubacteriales bacterium]|nr:hypothetical protein [Eubacteriales bacterium]